MNARRILGKTEEQRHPFVLLTALCFDMFSLGGGTCYDLVNAFACFCPDRVFRPQCNSSGVPFISAPNPTVLISSSNRK